MVASRHTSSSRGKSTSTDKITPSIKDRRKHAPLFHQCYSDLCKLRNAAPNPLLKAQAGKYILDFCGDRIKIDEWAPILEALKHDRSLHFIAIRSRYPDKKVLEDADTEVKARAISKRPVILTKFIWKLLLDSLSTCIAESTSVICIELEGLPLTLEYLSILCKGFVSNASLQTISFCNSPIGDEGCKHLCLYLRNMPSVYHLDFSNCNLTLHSASELAETLKYQTLQRYAESWKQSLRYREPDIESMPGLRRIILNNNIRVGDEGLKHLTEVLKEDLWLRALDLQNCGLSNVGAQEVLEMLDMNGTLCIVDLRDNRAIDETLTHQIMLRLFHNNANKDAHEYNWIIPRSQLTTVPSSQSLRSRQSASDKRIASMKSACSVVTPSTVQKCKSLYTARRNPSDRKLPSRGDSIQRHHTVISQSTSAINQRLRKPLIASSECVPKSKESKQQIKITTDSKPISDSSCGKLNIVEPNEEINASVEQKEKENFCFVKAEAYEAVFEALGGFSTFMKQIKEVNKGYLTDTNFSSEEKLNHHGDDGLRSQRAVPNLIETEISDVSKDNHSQISETLEQEAVREKGEVLPYRSVIDYESNTTSSVATSPRSESKKDTDTSCSMDQGTLTSSLSKIQELYDNLIKVSGTRGKDQVEE